MDPRCLQEALAYQAKGVRVVVFRNQTKKPMFEGWGHSTTLDEDELIEQFDRCPSSNIGVLLGEYPDGDPLPGIIDIEFDSPQGRETADKYLRGVITPTYESKRSVHRLFLWDDAFPPIQKIGEEGRCGGLEVRLGGGNKQSQSVLPPSIHEDRKFTYKWLSGLSIHEVDIQPVPDEIRRWIISDQLRMDEFLGSDSMGGRKSTAWDDAEEGKIAEGGRNVALAQIVGRVLGDPSVDVFDNDEARNALAIARKKNELFNPPLPDGEVKQVVMSILRRERSSREREDDLGSQPSLPSRGSGEETCDESEQGSDGKPPVVISSDKTSGSSNGFTLRVETSEPKRCYLMHPQFTLKPVVVCGMSDVIEFATMRRRIAEECGVILHDGLKKRWRAISARLYRDAEYLPPAAEVDRRLVVANYLLDHSVRGGTPLSVEDVRSTGINASAGVVLVDEGNGKQSIGVAFDRAMREMSDRRLIDKLTRAEFSDTLKHFKAEPVRDSKKRWWRISEDKFPAMESAIRNG